MIVMSATSAIYIGENRSTPRVKVKKGRSIQVVVDALSARGVEIEPDGLRMKPKRKAR
jgi:hypothetical protein